MYNNNNRGNYNNNKNFNKEPKKDWRRRTTHQPNGLPKNMRVEIPVSCYGITMDGKEYDGSTFMDIMSELQDNGTFNKISIPIYVKASYATGNPDAKWPTVIGYMKSFDDDMANATCIIYTKSIKVYEKLTTPIIVPRVIIKQGECACIVGLDIVEESDIKK